MLCVYAPPSLLLDFILVILRCLVRLFEEGGKSSNVDSFINTSTLNPDSFW